MKASSGKTISFTDLLCASDMSLSMRVRTSERGVSRWMGPSWAAATMLFRDGVGISVAIGAVLDVVSMAKNIVCKLGAL